jgi:hypothetical protein
MRREPLRCFFIPWEHPQKKAEFYIESIKANPNTICIQIGSVYAFTDFFKKDEYENVGAQRPDDGDNIRRPDLS